MTKILDALVSTTRYIILQPKKNFSSCITILITLFTKQYMTNW